MQKLGFDTCKKTWAMVALLSCPAREILTFQSGPSLIPVESLWIPGQLSQALLFLYLLSHFFLSMEQSLPNSTTFLMYNGTAVSVTQILWEGKGGG